MSETYGDVIDANLDRLAFIAVIHPRLGLVGAESELECILREMVPRYVLQKWQSRKEFSRRARKEEHFLSIPVSDDGELKWTQYVDEQWRTDCVRRALEKILPQRSWFSEDTREFLPEFVRKVNQWRHGRYPIEKYEVPLTIVRVAQFVRELRSYTEWVSCPECQEKTAFRFAWIFNRQIGRSFEWRCRKCASLIEEWEAIPRPDDRSVNIADEPGAESSSAYLELVGRGMSREVDYLFEGTWCSLGERMVIREHFAGGADREGGT